MDRSLGNAIQQAGVETLTALGGEAVKPGAPTEGGDPRFKPDVSVVISIVGQMSGAFVLRCTQDYASRLAGNMLGMPVDKGSEEMKDAIGEVHNMIVGAIKRHLDGSSELFNMSVPTTIVGTEYSIHIKASNASNQGIVPFLVGTDILGIEVFLEN